MKNNTKEGLKFWGAMSVGAAVPSSAAALMGAPWWGVTLSALFVPVVIIGFIIVTIKIMTSIF